MPITQDRVMNLITACEHYRKALFALQKGCLDTICQDGLGLTTRLQMVHAELTSYSEPKEILETLLVEKAHFKANHKRNDTRRRYMERRRMLETSTAFDEQIEQTVAEARAKDIAEIYKPPAYFNEPDPVVDIHRRQPEGTWPGLSAEERRKIDAEAEAAILAEGKAHAAEIRGQEALGEIAHHPDQILNRGSNFGLAAPPPPRIHSETDNNTARKLTPQEIQEMADRGNAAGYGSEPL